MSAAGKARGFTLIEMLVVIAITALVAGIAFPALDKMLPRQNFEMAARTLDVSLREARADAVRRDRPVRFALGADRRSYASDARVPIALPEGVALSLSAQGIVFFGDGSTSGGAVSLTGGTHALIVEVDAATGAIGARR